MSNKERQAAYRQVIQSLLECSQNDEERILLANPDLVDEGLVKALKDTAKMMMIRNNPALGATIQRLVSFAQQLERKLAAVQSEIVELEQEDYIRFSFELLKIVADSQGDGEIVHQFFDSHLAYLNVHLLTIFPQSIQTLLDREKDRHWQADIASVLHNLAIDLQNYPRGDRSISFALSIACKERSLLVCSQPEEQILQGSGGANNRSTTEIVQADRDRQTAYFELVHELIQCPLNDEERILNTHPELVDRGLVVALLEVADIRKEHNNPDLTSTIEWLESFAEQLNQKLELQQEEESLLCRSQPDESRDRRKTEIVRADEKQRQTAYFDLVQALIQCPLNDEERVLSSRPELVDKGLVIALLEVAQIRKKRNHPDSASTIEWLESFAEQLSQRLDLQLSEIQQMDDGESDTLLQKVANNQFNEEIVHQFIDENDNIEIELDDLDLVMAGQIQVETIDYAAIQQLIHSPHTAILTCDTTNDDTHIFIIKQSGAPTIHTCKTQGKQKFQNWLQKTWINPCHDDTSNWAENLPRLLHDISQRLELDILVEQHLTDITELIIFPHLNLQHIPFAALPFTPAEGGLLGDRFIIRSIPSLQSCQLHPPITTTNIGTVEEDNLHLQSTLWIVDDYVSVIFNMMYQEQQNTNHAAALRLAQSRLRNLTGAEFHHHYYSPAIEYVTKHHPTLKTALEQHLEAYCQMDKPFESPYYWASFITQGLT